MPTGKPSSPRSQKRLLVRELQTGTIYRDVLSGHLVLIEERGHSGPSEMDVRKTVRTAARVGYYWNPLFGAHMTMELHDHQFINADAPNGPGMPQ